MPGDSEEILTFKESSHLAGRSLAGSASNKYHKLLSANWDMEHLQWCRFCETSLCTSRIAVQILRSHQSPYARIAGESGLQSLSRTVFHNKFLERSF